eukprot:scaffold9189_cov101-Isochrysis_galbana.AAC.1
MPAPRRPPRPAGWQYGPPCGHPWIQGALLPPGKRGRAAAPAAGSAGFVWGWACPARRPRSDRVVQLRGSSPAPSTAFLFVGPRTLRRGRRTPRRDSWRAGLASCAQRRRAWGKGRS